MLILTGLKMGAGLFSMTVTTREIQKTQTTGSASDKQGKKVHKSDAYLVFVDSVDGS